MTTLFVNMKIIFKISGEAIRTLKKVLVGFGLE
jgi:hypothetical protein